MPEHGMIAANTNLPLWQRVTLDIALNGTDINGLSDTQRAALWEKAVATMKPDAKERAQMDGNTEAQNAYMLSFVKAYKAGMPPLAQLTENSLT